MKDYEPITSWGEEDAAFDAETTRGDEAAAVAFLAAVARGGHALELAIGTGRIALPLAARGVTVDGIDFSPAMLAKLREKPGGDRLSATVGNMADVPVTGTYALVYVVYNSLFNLLTQEEQVRCFENVASRLSEDGSFVVEAMVPSFFYRLRNDQYVDAEAIEVDEVVIDVLRHDGAEQTIAESHVSLSSAGVRLSPVVQRYAWPAELDLMARIAGLRLKERWGGWDRQPYGSTSIDCVSVYGR